MPAPVSEGFGRWSIHQVSHLGIVVSLDNRAAEMKQDPEH
jgi:hypothetical protein